MKTLNVIGCGNLGSTLSRLWSEAGVFAIGQILNRSKASAHRAVEFVGAGNPVSSFSELRSADAILIATPDDAIRDCCERLATTSASLDHCTVFHCSGSLSSHILSTAAVKGAHTGSVHPVKSFADPTASVDTFAGTYCALEADAIATAVLRPTFEAIGARVFSVDPDSKPIYHGAAVFACNYVTALMEVGLRCYETAGIPPETGLKILEPMVRETIDNIFRMGPTKALTGPIARGDVSTVTTQGEAMIVWNELVGRLYGDLGMVAADLSETQGNASESSLERIRDALSRWDS